MHHSTRTETGFTRPDSTKPGRKTKSLLFSTLVLCDCMLRAPTRPEGRNQDETRTEILGRPSQRGGFGRGHRSSVAYNPSVAGAALQGLTRPERRNQDETRPEKGFAGAILSCPGAHQSTPPCALRNFRFTLVTRPEIPLHTSIPGFTLQPGQKFQVSH